MKDKDTLILENLYLEASEEENVRKMAHKKGYKVGPVYHYGTFNINEGDTIFEPGNDGVHFGTLKAAEMRTIGHLVDEFIKELEYDEDEEVWGWSSGPYESMEPFGTKEEAEEDAQNVADSIGDIAMDEWGSLTKVFLKINKPMRLPDRGTWDTNKLKNIKSKGYDSVIYVNRYEDKGKESYIVFYPEQIKLADSITYDDQGSPIPLKQRFNPNNPDVRY